MTDMTIAFSQAVAPMQVAFGESTTLAKLFADQAVAAAATAAADAASAVAATLAADVLASQTARTGAETARDTSTSQATLAQHYANDDTDTPIPGAPSSAYRGAKYWATTLGALYAMIWNQAGYLFGVGDSRGFFRMTIDTAGKLWAQTAEFVNATIANLTVSSIPTTGAQPFSVPDPRGFAGLALDGDTAKAPKVKAEQFLIGSAKLRPALAPQLDLGSEVELIIIDGQSLAAALNAGALLGKPVPNALMLSTGLRTITAAYTAVDVSATTLVQMAEALNYSGSSVLGQSVATGIVQSIQEAIERDTGVPAAQQTKRYIVLNVAESGASIEQLSRGASYVGVSSWGLMETAVTRIKALCDAAGMHVTCRRVFWMQGEANNTNSAAVYDGKLQAFVADLQTYLKPILGQIEDIHLFTYQTASQGAYGYKQTVPLGQLSAALANPLIHVVSGMNNVSYVDGVHITAGSEMDMGAQFGRAAYRAIERGEGEGPIVRPIAKKIVGDRCLVKFAVPVLPLVIDADIAARAVNAGVSLRTSADVLIPIKQVEVRGDWIAFRTNDGSSIPAGAVVWIGRDPEAQFNAATGGPRIAIRDSSGDYAPNFDPLGRNKPIHNWAVIASI